MNRPHLGFHHRTRKRLARCAHPAFVGSRNDAFERERFTCTNCGAWVEVSFQEIVSSPEWQISIAEVRRRMPSRIPRKRPVGE